MKSLLCCSQGKAGPFFARSAVPSETSCLLPQPQLEAKDLPLFFHMSWSLAEHSPVSCKTFSNFSSYLIPRLLKVRKGGGKGPVSLTAVCWVGWLLCIDRSLILAEFQMWTLHARGFFLLLYCHCACGPSVPDPVIFRSPILSFWLQKGPMLCPSSVSLL